MLDRLLNTNDPNEKWSTEEMLQALDIRIWPSHSFSYHEAPARLSLQELFDWIISDDDDPRPGYMISPMLDRRSVGMKSFWKAVAALNAANFQSNIIEIWKLKHEKMLRSLRVKGSERYKWSKPLTPAARAGGFCFGLVCVKRKPPRRSNFFCLRQKSTEEPDCFGRHVEEVTVLVFSSLVKRTDLDVLVLARRAAGSDRKILALLDRVGIGAGAHQLAIARYVHAADICIIYNHQVDPLVDHAVHRLESLDNLPLVVCEPGDGDFSPALLVDKVSDHVTGAAFGLLAVAAKDVDCIAGPVQHPIFLLHAELHFPALWKGNIRVCASAFWIALAYFGVAGNSPIALFHHPARLEADDFAGFGTGLDLAPTLGFQWRGRRVNFGCRR